MTCDMTKQSSLLSSTTSNSKVTLPSLHPVQISHEFVSAHILFQIELYKGEKQNLKLHIKNKDRSENSAIGW